MTAATTHPGAPSTRRPRPGSGPRALLLFLLIPITAAPARAQEEDPGPLFDGRDAWIASAYLATAAIAFPLDEPIAEAIQDSALQDVRWLGHTATGFNLLGFPGSLIISSGLWGVGRLVDEPDMADVGLHTAEAIVMAEAVTYLLKVTAGRARPDVDVENSGDFKLFRGLRGDEYQSFPSGHSTAAFAVAASLAHELERLWGGNDILYGVATYGPASLVALARMFDNRHWTSDVVFGAAIGAFSGWKVVKYNHDNPDNTLNDWFLAASFRPGDLSTLRIGLLPRPRARR